MTSSPSPTPTERLEAAAAWFDHSADGWEWAGETGLARQERAVAALLDAIAVRLRSPIDQRFQPNYVAPALAVADAVLGEQP